MPRATVDGSRDEAEALLALADRLGVQAAVWGGHSMGGMKAMRIALIVVAT